MKESDKRIGFITDYISAYEEKIRLSNSNGLFDSAKLFELFAIKVGGLYLGQALSNLNIDTYTFPCVDLVSQDEKLYVQVSTAKDIPAKIKSTLEKIRDSSRPEIKNIKQVKFIVLNNESIKKVKNYSGKGQIGDIPFVKDDDLITTQTMLQKANNDLGFQIKLYELLKREVDSVKGNSEKLKEAIDISKSVGLGNIDCKINNEYEIDRSELLNKVREEDFKNISIQGVAGSGKSVLCKLLVQDEDMVVYAKAERFREESDINKIWGFDLRKALEYLADKPITFFIDSLEFIADVPTKIDILQTLYEFTKDYQNVKVITSCRTSDKSAFIRIEGNYQVDAYEVSELTVAELGAIAKKYPIIRKMAELNTYEALLKSPFYVNLILSKNVDVESMADENQFREYIWKNIICLNDNNVEKIVNEIVFKRATEFLLWVNANDYDKKMIDKLISAGVLISNESLARLKYDIFEDICFEQFFDKKFVKCKGRYGEFFRDIEALGRCVFRHYQIWISNKLLEKENREKFISKLIFSVEVSGFWQKQTIIGLVKSRHCQCFFDEYENDLISKGVIEKFISIANLYAFEIDNNFIAKFSPVIMLNPAGQGRGV